MTALRQAAQQALEALDGVDALLTSMDVTHLLVYEEVNNAITALRAALAEPTTDDSSAVEPAQGPLATMTVREDMGADFKFNRPHTLLPGQQFHLHLAPLQRKEGT